MMKRSKIVKKIKMPGLTALVILFFTGTGYTNPLLPDTGAQMRDKTPDKSGVSGYVKQAGIFKLAIDNPEGFRYRIRVTDDRGKIWYQESTSSGKFRRFLDLSYPSSKCLKVTVKGPGEEIVYAVHRAEAKYSAEKMVE